MGLIETPDDQQDSMSMDLDCNPVPNSNCHTHPFQCLCKREKVNAMITLTSRDEFNIITYRFVH